MNGIPRKRGKDTSHLHDKLFHTLETLRNFFHSGGKGIRHERLHTTRYTVSDRYRHDHESLFSLRFFFWQALHSKLEILRLSTDELTCRYISDLVQLQSKHEETDSEDVTGTLHFSVAYFKEKSTVEATILQGISLPPSHGNDPSTYSREDYNILR